jgi:hypothetical protein
MDKKTIKNTSKQEETEFPTKKGKETMAKIMVSMQQVDTNTPEAKLNETSMDDNNGGRVIYTLQKGEAILVNGRKVIIVNIKK